MMGAGKSAVGELLAHGRGVEFFDSDAIVEGKAGRSISQIWDDEGEAGLRRRESAVIASLASAGDGVVATGGGAVLDPGNVDTMRRSGTVVWLDARPTTLAARLGDGQGRPLLQGAEPRVALVELTNRRRPQYLAAAHYRVSTDGRTLDDLAAEIEELWTRS